ncbi:MAG: hypothetical protein UFX72_07660 [Adlercreutzia sp.]|nr:hypothetical protein [Adlercreutzia sp.]
METMETITTAITGLGTSLQSAIGANLPAILSVAAIFIVVPAVWSFVRRFTH